MGIKLFFRKWLSSEEKLTFYASVFTALTVSVETLHPDKVNAYIDFAESLQLNEYDTEVFKERVKEYETAIFREDIHLNDLIQKIGRIAKRNPEWIAEIPLEALMLCVVKDEILQRRVLDFIITLLKESSN
ncbi:MAG: hypothetical protein OIF32_09820 [Campylobacterales bacterium]|nr:hypothetical protein [Campylobacterales bacterium]